MRYKILKYIDSIRGKKVSRCVFCGRKLKKVEEYYYGCSCEKCERKYAEWEL